MDLYIKGKRWRYGGLKSGCVECGATHCPGFFSALARKICDGLIVFAVLSQRSVRSRYPR